MPKNAIGIDIGGTNIRAARVGEDGTILARRALATRRDAADCLADCLALIDSLRDAETVAVGIGVPGQVDFERQAVLSGGYVDLSGLPFAHAMHEATGLPITIDNDASMALIGETARGAAKGLSNAVLLTIGTGIGGAILDHGRILRGSATAGQLGHLVVNPNGRACVCGRKGCVETESSGTAFATHLAEAGLPQNLKAQELMAAAEHDPRAEQVLRRWAQPLRAAIDSLITTLAPEAVLIGGGAGAAALAALERVPPAKSWFDAPVISAALQDDAGITGAAVASFAEGRKAVLVNGVPASGKSGVAQHLSAATGWPILALDTIKAPFLAELGPVDRPMNRRLGRAAYEAIFDTIAAAPQGSVFIIDAWFGFQPLDVLTECLARAGIVKAVEVWCSAAPQVIADRYARRVPSRPAGHPGLEYVPELLILAERAHPTGQHPVLRVDTEKDIDGSALAHDVRILLQAAATGS